MRRDRRARGLITASCLLVAAAGLGCDEKKPASSPGASVGAVEQAPTKAPPKGTKVGNQKVMPQ